MDRCLIGTLFSRVRTVRTQRRNNQLQIGLRGRDGHTATDSDLIRRQ